MNVKINPRLEAVLNEFAQREAVPPETIILRALWEKFGKFTPPLEPRDDWERLVSVWALIAERRCPMKH